MSTKNFTAIVFGTGEKLVTSRGLGVGHELVMALLNAKIDAHLIPEIDGHKFEYSSVITEDPFLESDGKFDKLTKVTLDQSNPARKLYKLPSHKTCFGVDFHEHDLLVINGVNPSLLRYVFQRHRIKQEIHDKAHAIAEHYFRQILVTPEDNIKLFIYGYSRGACISMQAMNILYKKLKQYDSQYHTNFLDKTQVDAFMLDPVPGHRGVSKDKLSRTIPKFVRNFSLIYSEAELRAGFQPLRNFHKQSMNTKIDMNILPGGHSAVVRHNVNVDGVVCAPVEITTALLKQAYKESTGKELAIAVFKTKKSGISHSRRYYPAENNCNSIDYSEAHKKAYKKRALEIQQKFFGMFSFMFRSSRKFRGDCLQKAYIDWPTDLNKLKKQCVKQHKMHYIQLVNMLDLLLKHGYKSQSENNALLIYDNFDKCILGLEKIIKNNNGTDDFCEGFSEVEQALNNIRQNARHDNALAKIVLATLALLFTLCTLGVSLIVLYNSKINNPLSFQCKTVYLTDNVDKQLHKAVKHSKVG